MNSVDDLTPAVLGYAESVYEQTLGEDKYTFVEGCKDPHSCTILVKGSAPHVIAQVKDAFRDSLRAAKNALDVDGGYVVPGAGAVEVAASLALGERAKGGKGGGLKEGGGGEGEAAALKNGAGVQLLADALLVVPKLLAQNSGFDALETVMKLSREQRGGIVAGVDVGTGEAIDPVAEHIVENVCVKRQIIRSACVLAVQILLVDDVLAAGKPGVAQNSL